MHAFITAKETTASNNRFVRFYPAAELDAQIPVDKMFIDCGGESKILSDAFEKQEKDMPKSEPAKSPVTLVGETQLLAWEHCPPRLGRVGAKLLTPTMHLHSEDEPLILQLTALKAKKPSKKHFRIAVTNAYGTNLGDATLGATAMRYVAKTLQEYLGSFSLDMFIGAVANPANVDIVSHEPYVANVFFQGCTLQEFTKYDAYFDFTNLLNLPKFTELPAVDFYIWWMGLNHEIVAAEHKRNRMSIRWDAWQSVAAVLRDVVGKKRILFNPKASVPLRSCPPEIAKKLAKRMLEADSDLQLIVDQPMELKHKRLIDLSSQINSPFKFMALVAQLDGVITVDSFAPHLADACSTPCIQLCTSLPKEFYPYYPHSYVMEIPGARNLPAWMKCKIESAEEWVEMKSGYDAAWESLDVKHVLSELKAKIEAKNAGVVSVRPHLINKNHQLPCVVREKGLQRLKYDSASDMWLFAKQRLIELSSTLAKPGMTFVMTTPGWSDYPVALAQKLGGYGQLHVYEPRTQRRTLMANDVMHHEPNMTVHWHTTIPVPNTQLIRINQTDVYSESTPVEWGNVRDQVEVPASTIDQLGLTACHAMTFMPPMPAKMVLDGALATLRKYRPALIFAFIGKKDAHAVVELLKDDKYQFWAESAVFKGDFENLIMLGFPNEQKLNLNGFVQIRLER